MLQQSSMVEIVRTKEKIDSTLKVFLDFKLNNQNSNYKQIVICCQKDREAREYFDHVRELANIYPEINQLLILKTSTKKRLCIEENRGKHDEELYCRYKRFRDEQKCQYYTNYLDFKKRGRLEKKGLIDCDRLVRFGNSEKVCPYFHQESLVSQADILICEHSNIFKELERQKDIYQFFKMDPAQTYLFLDQSQYLIEDIQQYQSFHITQDMVHSSIRKCRSLKQSIQENKIVEESDLKKVKDEYEKMMNILQKRLSAKLKAESKDQPEKVIQELKEKADIPQFAKNPLLLIDYIENISFEVNSYFETHFRYMKSKEPVQSMLSDLNKSFSTPFQLRIVLDELFSYLLEISIRKGGKGDDAQNLDSIYMISDFIYFFSENFYGSESSQKTNKGRGEAIKQEPLKIQSQTIRCFFQDHPEYLQKHIADPILVFCPKRISTFSKKIFKTCKAFALTSDCLIENFHIQTTTILGINNSQEFPISRLKQFDLDNKNSEYNDYEKLRVMPLLINKWNDQSTFQSTNKIEDQPLQLRNYVNLVNSICDIVPDGIVTFLPNISIYMRFIEEKLSEIRCNNRPIFFEFPFNPQKTLKAFEDYKKQCDIGLGALFFCEANGWAQRNIQFKNHYARTVLILGFPTRNETYYKNIDENKILDSSVEEFSKFDAIMRVTSCLKTAYTDSKDYCSIILADQQLCAEFGLLPTWITHNQKGKDDLTVDDLFQNILLYQKCMSKLQNQPEYSLP